MADKAQKESMRLARTVFIIFISFMIMYTPWSLIVALDRYDQVNNFRKHIRQCSDYAYDL